MGAATTILTAVFRYRRVILVAALALLLVLAECTARQNTDNTCGTAGPAISANGLLYPVDPSTPITSGYRTPSRPDHRGVDFGVPEGTPIHALADGTVIAAQDHGVQGFGGWVVLSHVINGQQMSTVYGHINPGGVHVTVGQQVRAGDVIASSGNAGESSGPHLHFELWNGDRLRGGTGTDPTPVLNSIKNSTATSGGNTTDQADEAAPGAADAVTRNAAIIIRAGRADGVPDDAIVIALAVGLVESGMHNWASAAVPESQRYPNDGVPPGDADSVGVLQQRPSQGWGSVKDLMNPEFQAHNFFTRLMASDWQHKSFTDAAADIQRPREDLRGLYGQREAEARALFARVSGHMPADSGQGCSPATSTPGTPAPTGSTKGPAIVAAARKQIGLPYIWGCGNIDGPTGGGFDCSGLVLYAVHAATGITLPHTSNDQFRLGDPVPVSPTGPTRKEPDMSSAEPGDIVFFGLGTDAEHEGVYVGTVQGTPTMVHSPDFGQSVVQTPVTAGGTVVGVRRYTNTDPNSTSTGALAAMQKESR